LRAAGCIAAEEEAGELLEAAPNDETLEVWIRRRERGEPLAWITGTARFGDHSLHVDPGVYVPRLQSEELARRAAAILADGGTAAADLCTGAGAVAVHLMARAPAATVVGVDLDPRAAACARRNGVRAIVGDLDGPLRANVFDVVTAIAPYVPTDELRLLPADVRRYEPTLALDGGADGLDVIRRVVAAGARLLRGGGWLLVEIGGDQDRALTPTLGANGFTSIEPWFDEDGDLRGIAAQATG
jgi:release factor glutamine methyltransferase